MNILYLGDIMGEAGLELVERELPNLIREYKVDFVVAQAENTTNGKGLSDSDFGRLKRAGVDVCTGGNWSLFNESIYPMLSDPHQPVVRPANYPAGTAGKGYVYVQSTKGPVLVVSLLGSIVGKDADKPVDNPLKVIDQILQDQADVPKVAIVVNFHGDFSSEKKIIGNYLDGRVSVVVGDHWHVQTSDASVLPGGTAHITDVGMCGSLDSSLGVTFAATTKRWKDNVPMPNILETTGRMQINALLAEIDVDTGLAKSATSIRKIYT